MNSPDVGMEPRRIVRALGIALVHCFGLRAQKLDPIQWTLTVDQAKAPPGSKVVAKLTAKAEPGWHLYSLSTPPPGPDGGPIATTLAVAADPHIAKAEIWQPKPERYRDPNFNLDVE